MHGLPPRSEIERCYSILELDHGSSSTLVDASWRKLVDEWRPDRFVSDPVLHARAEMRVSELNHAHEQVTRHLARELTPVTRPVVRTGLATQPASYLRRTLVASTAFAGLTIAAVLIARPSTHQKSKPAHIPSPAVAPAEVPPPKPAARSEITLRAHAPLTVSVTSVADGRILLPETTLHAGQSTTVPRLGPAFLK
jgi:hypothetical protein